MGTLTLPVDPETVETGWMYSWHILCGTDIDVNHDLVHVHQSVADCSRLNYDGTVLWWMHPTKLWPWPSTAMALCHLSGRCDFKIILKIWHFYWETRPAGLKNEAGNLRLFNHSISQSINNFSSCVSSNGHMTSACDTCCVCNIFRANFLISIWYSTNIKISNVLMVIKQGPQK